MDGSPTIVPMSDRRLVVAVVGVLAAALGAAIALLALLALRHPVGATGDEGVLQDFGPELVAAIGFGILLAGAGGGTAVALVRAQLQQRRT